METIILKFGGTSVNSSDKWEKIEKVVRDRANSKLVVVCSAISGVSDDLTELLNSSGDDRTGAFNKIVEKHQALAMDLDISFEIIKDQFDKFGDLVKELPKSNVPPRLKAEVMAYGEIFSTKLGEAFLKMKGLDVSWVDARTLLKVSNDKSCGEERRYLSSSCDYEPNHEAQKVLKERPLVITQGFIASDNDGETVLLGRGGSDVSAAYLAATLSASRCEIWSDVPGMYTANPRLVPTARMLTILDYDEALEIALFGGKILHPRTIAPLRKYQIPLHIYSLDHLEAGGTIVSADAGKKSSGVKAISARLGVVLISMETVDMWHQVGFLADAFETFKKHGLSIDLISTSESNVTVTLDSGVNVLDKSKIDKLKEDLSKICNVRIISSCAVVSLVGRNIRSMLYRITPALEVFNEQRVYMVAQAANDLNLTFVVDEEQADRMVSELHEDLFQHQDENPVFGAMWRDFFEKEKGPEESDWWWSHKKDKLLELVSNSGPMYVYDQETIRKKIEGLKSIKSLDKVYYSIKANRQIDVLKEVYHSGLNFECVSLGELDFILKEFPEIDPKRILFTPNFASIDEYKQAFKVGTYVTLDNLYPLKMWPEVFKSRDLFIRVDPGTGQGHHKYVKTAGSKSKFGVSIEELDELKELIVECGAKVIGLHSHVGSNIHTPDTWSNTANILLSLAGNFPDLKILDLGGGLGVVERPGQAPLDLMQVDKNLELIKKENPDLELWIEPGRFLVAEAGVLLSNVTQTKRKGDYYYVGLEVGMNTLIRPALYGSHHEIVNLSKYGEMPTTIANIVGPICETGDVLGYSRKIVPPEKDDVFLIAVTGAYGRVMSSSYNLRQPAKEYFLKA